MIDQGNIEFGSLHFEPIAERPSKVGLADLGRPTISGGTMENFLLGLPNILGVRSFRNLGDAIIEARTAGSQVIAAIGGHVIKTGCGPYLVDLLERGILTGVALNGSAAIHDLELAIAGHTSEDVKPRLEAGLFGFARETSLLFAEACSLAATRGIGLGRALGEVILACGGPGLDSSVLVSASRLKLPATVHVAVGTDVVHMTPQLDGAALGQAALEDFRILCGSVSQLKSGVWLNLGSAVIMPEVFIKSVAIARNLGFSLEGMTTANLDFLQQYRGTLNVIERPGNQGIALTGHHEILIPLLHSLVVARWVGVQAND